MKFLLLSLINSLLLTYPVFAADSQSDSYRSIQLPDTVIIIDTEIKYQVIHNFGASDAWACQFVGLWPDQKRNRIADLLFSTEVNKSGQPIGIGLSLWRFNIGAGSKEQKNISDEWRSTESFLNHDGTYDWTKQAGQRWFLNAASQRGVNQFIGFTNSPPVTLTKNGKAFSDVNDRGNIDPENYLSFAKFLIEVADHLRQKEGITFNYLSPFNEPQWEWTGHGQEGSPYTNQEMYDIVKVLDSLVTNRRLPYKIMIGEAGQYNFLYEDANRPKRADQINTFFNRNSSLYIGNLPGVEKSISAHSYFTTAPVEKLLSVRQKLNNRIKEASVPLEFWQSEYCVLGNEEEISGNGKDLGIKTALYVARLIHYDLTVADASAWHWWLAVSAYDYKDGLIYVDKNEKAGDIEESKLLWALGNFSRFIRPGSVRVEATAKNINIENPKGLMVSSYMDKINNKLIVVLINYGETEISSKLMIKGVNVQNFIPYLTSSSTDKGLVPQQPVQPSVAKITIGRRSIVTLVGSVTQK